MLLTSAKKIAVNGILIALTVIVLFLATVLPTSRLSLYALSSFFTAVVIIELGPKNGWLFYISSCILALIIIPNKLGILPYAFFFGMYGLVKFHVERLNRIIIEYILKVAYFNACLVLAILFIKEFFLASVKVEFPWWVVIVVLEIVFIVYDYAYTLFVRYYREKIKRLLKI